MSARAEILSRIRATRRGPDDYTAIPRAYRDGSSAPHEEMVAQFVERLTDYNAAVRRCAEGGIAQTVAEALAARGIRGLLVPPGVPELWLPSGCAFARDEGQSYAELDASEGVLTGCAVAIALTGTIVLHHAAGNGRRALTLIPDYHLCVVFESQIVASVPEGVRAMAALRPGLLTTISGPSATSDIEMTRVKGVHGPRTLEVILVCTQSA